MPANRSRAQSLKTTCGSARWADLSEWDPASCYRCHTDTCFRMGGDAIGDGHARAASGARHALDQPRQRCGLCAVEAVRLVDGLRRPGAPSVPARRPAGNRRDELKNHAYKDEVASEKARIGVIRNDLAA
jgi:hypothetical protein